MIGNGKPEHIQDFIDYTGYAGIIMTDPELKSYTALGFTKKLSGIFSASTVLGGLKALKNGHRQADIQGNALQLGGAIVVGPGPRLNYYYQSSRADDFPPVEEMLEGCLVGNAGPAHE